MHTILLLCLYALLNTTSMSVVVCCCSRRHSVNQYQQHVALTVVAHSRAVPATAAVLRHRRTRIFVCMFPVSASTGRAGWLLPLPTPQYHINSRRGSGLPYHFSIMCFCILERCVCCVLQTTTTLTVVQRCTTVQCLVERVCLPSRSIYQTRCCEIYAASGKHRSLLPCANSM